MILIIAFLCLNLFVLFSIYISYKKSEPYLTLRELGRKIEVEDNGFENEEPGPSNHLLAIQDRKRYLYLSAHRTGISTR